MIVEKKVTIENLSCFSQKHFRRVCGVFFVSPLRPKWTREKTAETTCLFSWRLSDMAEACQFCLPCCLQTKRDTISFDVSFVTKYTLTKNAWKLSTLGFIVFGYNETRRNGRREERLGAKEIHEKDNMIEQNGRKRKSTGIQLSENKDSSRWESDGFRQFMVPPKIVNIIADLAHRMWEFNKPKTGILKDLSQV